MVNYCLLRSNLFPGSLIKQDQHRQDLQSAEQHNKCEDNGGKIVVPCKTGIGTYRFKGGTDVRNTGQCRREVAEKAVTDFIVSGI